jgi:hypothetical protein
VFLIYITDYNDKLTLGFFFSFSLFRSSNNSSILKKRIGKKGPKKSANSTQPISLYVEMLLVADVSIVNDHKQFAGSNDLNQVFMHMKIYYAHLINGVRFFKLPSSI